jgi:hypothetical protein
MGDLGGEEIAASPARRLRDAAAEFAAVAILADIAPDRQMPFFAPERLEQAGGGPKPRIERLVDVMFFENVCRDERQSAEIYRVRSQDRISNSGAMLRAPVDTKPIRVMAAEIYRGPIGRTGFFRFRWLALSGLCMCQIQLTNRTLAAAPALSASGLWMFAFPIMCMLPEGLNSR